MNYSVYRTDFAWKVLEVLKISVSAGVIGYLFYNSAVGMVAVLPFMPLIWKRDKLVFIDGRRRRIRDEFKEMAALLSGNLNAGYSLENALIQAAHDMEKQDGKHLMECELKVMVNGLRCNKRVEELLIDFGSRSEITEISDLANLIAAAKIHGGNLIKLIRQTAHNLSDISMIELEIGTMISAKRLEGRIMMIMPFAIILYMRLTNPAYMASLYGTVTGRIIMSISLIMIFGAGELVSRITRIGV